MIYALLTAHLYNVKINNENDGISNHIYKVCMKNPDATQNIRYSELYIHVHEANN